VRVGWAQLRRKRWRAPSIWKRILSGRIGAGRPAPTYATLAGLLGAHMAHIPFENFDVLLGREVRLDLDGLQTKLVKAHRGGYCFEHSTLFAAALERLGFEPVRHAARVVVFMPAAQSPRTHMFLTVAADGARYVVDPGFGPFGSRMPVPLDGAGAPADRPTTASSPKGSFGRCTSPVTALKRLDGLPRSMPRTPSISKWGNTSRPSP